MWWSCIHEQLFPHQSPHKSARKPIESRFVSIRFWINGLDRKDKSKDIIKYLSSIGPWLMPVIHFVWKRQTSSSSSVPLYPSILFNEQTPSVLTLTGDSLGYWYFKQLAKTFWTCFKRSLELGFGSLELLAILYGVLTDGAASKVEQAAACSGWQAESITSESMHSIEHS